MARDTPPSVTFLRPEILASHFSAKSIEQAVALGFRANGAVRAPGLGLGLTRLLAPEGLSADQALEMLHNAFPEENIGVNQKYRIYRTATGVLPADHAEAERAPVPMATPCGTDKCFGASIINWQPKLQECAKSVRIGVIDTGFDASHPAFKNRAIEVRRIAPAHRDISPNWHGTGVLALLAGDERSNAPGLIPSAKYYLADIFYADEDGQPASDTASIIEALNWLESKSVDIINMSFAGPPDAFVEAAVKGLSARKVLLVAAAGNEGPSAPPSYPAAYASVFAVTAVNKDLQSYRHASRGNHIDVAAPGVDIWTARPGGQGTYHSGTSFAVPYVTAVMAVLGPQLRNLSKAEILASVAKRDLGELGRDPIYGNGLLQAPSSCGAPPASPKPTNPAATAQAVIPN